MKTILSLVITGIFSIAQTGIASAQKISIKVNEQNEHIGGNKNPALVVTIYDATPEEVESKWKSLMKDNKAKVSTSDGVFADNAVISEINGNNTIDIWAKAEKIKDGETKLTVAFNLGGAFLSSSNDKDKFNAAKKMVNDFAIKTTRDAIAGIRKAEEKKLAKLADEQRDLEKQQEKLTSNIEDYNKKIEDYKKKIKEAEDDKAKNKTEQEKKKAEVETQKKQVEVITAKENAVD